MIKDIADNEVYNCASMTQGTEYLSRAIMIDQSAIGRTPRSNPATYTGAFTFIRDLFASTEGSARTRMESKSLLLQRKRGRCEACQGNGEIAVEMHFYRPCMWGAMCAVESDLKKKHLR